MKNKKVFKRVISLLLVAIIAVSTMMVTASAASYKKGTYVVMASNGVNVRTGAGTKYSKVGAAAKNVTFEVSQVSGSWGYTSSIKCTNGYKKGWVALDYCSLKKEAATTSNSSYTLGDYSVSSSNGINVRTGAGTGYSKVGAAAKGVSFKVTKISGSWGYTPSIKCTNGYKSGWVMLGYCKKVSSANSSTTVTKPANNSSVAVKLNVPLYKQSDSRWKNVYIGTKTIGAVGCTTTSIAMVYSYNSGKTVYPDAMRKMLKYSNNDLYWSSISKVGLTSKAYNCSLSNSMMSTIYSKLKAGRPVIIGAKTANGGSQHWVVITGYTGTSSTSFSSADFTINDPGYQNCNTLKAFLANGSGADRTKIIRIIY